MTEISTGAAAPEINVLVVDDIAQNLVAMSALLARPGVRVLTAPSAAAALELLLDHEVALALLDVQMPETDGFALAELMRGAERTRGVPIIFLTATPLDAARPFRGYEAGAVDFLSKPIDARVITSKVAVFVELFEQRRRLAERNAELQRALALNETMAAVLTHDLRTPLSAITMAVEVIRRKATDERLLKSAQHIRSSSLRMSHMIEQLLDFSQIRSNSLRLRAREADLLQACQAVIDEIALGRPGAKIQLHATGDLAGSFDADRLMQVFSNLIGNALQHGEPEHGVQVRLDGSQARRLVVAVRNRGALPPDVDADPFVAFRDRQGTGRDGLGLGLYIVDQFVRAHGGTVEARVDGQDTVFEFELPRHARADIPPSPPGRGLGAS